MDMPGVVENSHIRSMLQTRIYMMVEQASISGVRGTPNTGSNHHPCFSYVLKRLCSPVSELPCRCPIAEMSGSNPHRPAFFLLPLPRQDPILFLPTGASM
jgi:hypothetical protein